MLSAWQLQNTLERSYRKYVKECLINMRVQHFLITATTTHLQQILKFNGGGTNTVALSKTMR